tara:strand:+ start:5412 stop:5627 length:216 start_codon:yes stop_codon:yes gene_type:complete
MDSAEKTEITSLLSACNDVLGIATKLNVEYIMYRATHDDETSETPLMRQYLNEVKSVLQRTLKFVEKYTNG